MMILLIENGIPLQTLTVDVLGPDKRSLRLHESRVINHISGGVAILKRTTKGMKADSEEDG